MGSLDKASLLFIYRGPELKNDVGSTLIGRADTSKILTKSAGIDVEWPAYYDSSDKVLSQINSHQPLKRKMLSKADSKRFKHILKTLF